MLCMLAGNKLRWKHIFVPLVFVANKHQMSLFRLAGIVYYDGNCAVCFIRLSADATWCVTKC